MNKPVNPSPSTLVIIVFSAFLGFIAFAGTQLTVQQLKLPPNNLFQIFVGIATILFACAFTVFVLRKRDGRVTFGKLFVAAWMSSVVMAFLVAIFHRLNYTAAGVPPPTIGILATVILKYNAFGMIFSSLLAIIFKKQ